jgi:hypothetical protein
MEFYGLSLEDLKVKKEGALLAVCVCVCVCVCCYDMKSKLCTIFNGSGTLVLSTFIANMECHKETT